MEQSASLMQLLQQSAPLHAPEHEMFSVWQLPLPSQMLPSCVEPPQWNPVCVPEQAVYAAG